MKELLLSPRFRFDVACHNRYGRKLWSECAHNLVTSAGTNDLISTYFKGATYTAGWYMGLLSTGAIAASDTLMSHPGWTEISLYSGTRPPISFGVTASGANTGSLVSFAISGAANIAGAFIASASSGTGGILYSLTHFANVRSVTAGDTLSITPTVSVS